MVSKKFILYSHFSFQKNTGIRMIEKLNENTKKTVDIPSQSLDNYEKKDSHQEEK